jgi:hypothetical protein
MGDLSQETAEVLSAEKVDFKLMTGFINIATLAATLLYKILPGTIFGAMIEQGVIEAEAEEEET